MDTVYEKNENSISSSQDKLDREEMLWTTKIEQIFNHWAFECKEFGKLHNKFGRKYKYLYHSFGIPSVVIPLVMASVNQILGDAHNVSVILNSVGYFLTGTLTGITTFLNFSSKSEKHYYTEIRYKELYTDIQTLLIKPKRNRIAADIALEQFKLRFEHINEYAPDI